MKNKLKYIPTVVFLCFIFILTTLFVALPKSEYSSSEKRYLEKFPDISPESIFNGKFESGFETYLADHFPSRNTWVGINAYYNLMIGNNGNDGVYKCKNDYLINVPVSKNNRIEINAKAIADFTNNVNVPVTVEIAPSTGYIMDKVLPLVHNSYDDDNNFETIINTLKDNASSKTTLVDLRAAFKKASEKGSQLYYKTDHHWTTEGAYTAYKELCKMTDLKATPKLDFDIKSYDNFFGTTYSTSGFWLTHPDKIQVWTNKNHDKKSITVTITEGDESKTYSHMYFLNHLEEDDKYPVFLDGNHAVVNIVNKKVKNGKVLIVKDSFCHSLAPFLADNFNTITMVDMRYYKNSISDMVKNGIYDRVFVIYGIDNLATDSDLVWIK